MICPRCHSHIADGFYCTRCGYVPSKGDSPAAGAVRPGLLRNTLAMSAPRASKSA